MGKYNIDKSFGIGKWFKVPLNRKVVFLAKKVLKDSDKCLRDKKDVIVKSEKIKVQEGFIDVKVIIPCNSLSKNPCLFYIHGGGFAFDIQSHQYKNAVDYAIKTGSIVILPRYRLTPDVSYSIIFSDCFAAWEWMRKSTDKYQIDLEKVGIGGDSAGAYLAARLTNMVVKNNDKVCYQLLIYPVIDSKMRTKSMEKYIDTPMWNAKNNKIMWEWLYEKEEWDLSLLDEVLPFNIPSTYIETAEFDCLHDEGLLYANKLKKVGVDVIVHETHGTMHGFDCFETEITKEALEFRIQFINRQNKRM